MPKQTFPRIYLVPFCSSKLVGFFKKISKKLLFRQVLVTLIFLNSKMFEISLPIYLLPNEHLLKHTFLYLPVCLFN